MPPPLSGFSRSGLHYEGQQNGGGAIVDSRPLASGLDGQAMRMRTARVDGNRMRVGSGAGDGNGMGVIP